MSRRWVAGMASCGQLVAWAVVWRALPREPGVVAPQITAREPRQADRLQEGSPTRLGDGSKTQAHRLWAHYHDRPAIQGVRPHLLGISRVRLSGSTEQPDGIYSLVFSDHVFQYAFGGCCDGIGRQVVMVPDSGTSVDGYETDF